MRYQRVHLNIMSPLDKGRLAVKDSSPSTPLSVDFSLIFNNKNYIQDYVFFQYNLKLETRFYSKTVPFIVSDNTNTISGKGNVLLQANVSFLN